MTILATPNPVHALGEVGARLWSITDRNCYQIVARGFEDNEPWLIAEDINGHIEYVRPHNAATFTATEPRRHLTVVR